MNKKEKQNTNDIMKMIQIKKTKNKYCFFCEHQHTNTIALCNNCWKKWKKEMF